MWWLFLLIGLVFVVLLIAILAKLHFKKKAILTLRAQNEFKKYLSLTVVKVNDNRKIIYYSNGPMNIKYDPSNFSLYKTSLMEVSCYTADEKKMKRFGNVSFGLMMLFMVIALVGFVISFVAIFLNLLAPDTLSSLSGETLLTLKDVICSPYFCVGLGAIFILLVVYLITNRHYKKIFTNYIPVYLRIINTEIFNKANQPIYIKLD